MLLSAIHVKVDHQKRVIPSLTFYTPKPQILAAPVIHYLCYYNGIYLTLHHELCYCFSTIILTARKINKDNN